MTNISPDSEFGASAQETFNWLFVALVPTTKIQCSKANWSYRGCPSFDFRSFAPSTAEAVGVRNFVKDISQSMRLVLDDKKHIRLL